MHCSQLSYSGVYFRHPPNCRCSQLGGRYSLAAKELPPAATCVKVPPVSQVAALWGGKQNSSPPSLPGVAAVVADLKPAADISFSKIAHYSSVTDPYP
jgi:hypothetical protein